MNFSSVFHPSDFTPGDHGAFVHALRIALAARGDLTLLHVDDPDRTSPWNEFPHVRRTLAAWGMLPVEAPRDAVTQLGLGVRKVAAHANDVARGIVDHIREDEPDLVVMATHQRSGTDRWLHGALAEPVARQAGVKTLFVPRQTPGFISPETGQVTLRTVLIPVDRHPDPKAAVTAALELARILGAAGTRFIVFYAGDSLGLPKLELSLDPGWTCEYMAWAGNPVEHILSVAEAQSVDLVVMATAGHHGFLDALRGSTTERVLHGLGCPLLAVPVGV